MRLISLRRDKVCFVVDVQNENIAHFVHEQLQYLWIALETNRFRQVSVYVSSGQEWIREVTRAVAAYFGVDFLTKKPPRVYWKWINVYPGKPVLYRPSDLLMVREAVFRHFGVHPSSKRKVVLYTREDTARRRMLNSDILSDLFDVVVRRLDIPFKEQLSIFSGATHFVAPEGAHMTNLILLPSGARVLSLQVGRPNSWPLMFGSSCLVERFDASTTIVDEVRDPRNFRDACEVGVYNEAKVRKDVELDADIVVDDRIKRIVEAFLDDE